MKKFLQKRLGNEKGLTLVELLAVIVILGIIAAIAIPSIGGIIQNTREKAFVADAQNALSAANLYFTENNAKDKETVKLEKLKTEGFFNDVGTLTDVTVTFNAGKENTIDANGTVGNKPVSLTNKTNKQLSDEGRKAIVE
ncbi:MAG: prepilin-type N-terminal cleavage/methylation domain-containing protein [Sporosarcina sp.]